MAIRKKTGTGAPAKKTRGGKKSSTVITVDFTGVDAGGGMPTPDGTYIGTISNVDKEVSQAGNDMLVVRWKTNIGSTVFDRFVLVPQSLWVLRTALNCLGFDTEDAEYSFDYEEMVDQSCGIEITNEEYEEKDQPRVTGYLPLETAEGMVEKTEKKKPAKKSKPVEEPEEEEEEEEEAPPPRRRKAKPAEEEEEEETEEEEEETEEEEEEEEEEEAPPKKVVGKKKAAAEPPKKEAPKKVKSTALRPGASVTFQDEEENELQGVIESIEGNVATVLDDEETEWEIPLADLTKA